MKTFIVVYDLHMPVTLYKDLTAAIKSYRCKIHLQDSVWMIQEECSSTDIVRDLSKYIDKNDSLVVASLENDVTWTSGVNDEAKKWLGLAFS